jgi:hypothetical protein
MHVEGCLWREDLEKERGIFGKENHLRWGSRFKGAVDHIVVESDVRGKHRPIIGEIRDEDIGKNSLPFRGFGKPNLPFGSCGGGNGALDQTLVNSKGWSCWVE